MLYRMKTTYPSSLTDAEWSCLQQFLPPRSPQARLRRHSLRSVFEALFYLLRTGCPWRYLPSNFPHETPRILQRRGANQGSGEVSHPEPGESSMKTIERARPLACLPPGAVTTCMEDKHHQIGQGRHERDQEGER